MYYSTEIIAYYNMVQRLLRIIYTEIIAYYSTEIIAYYMVQRLLRIIIWYRDYCVL